MLNVPNFNVLGLVVLAEPGERFSNGVSGECPQDLGVDLAVETELLGGEEGVEQSAQEVSCFV
jgi:hypothetical protein